MNKITSLYDTNLPDFVIQKAKSSLLDYIAVTLAGTVGLKEKTALYLKNEELEAGRSTAIGMNLKLPLKEAVFLNGLNAHALDYDDGTNAGIIHLGSPIFSVLLPLAEKNHICAEKFFKAVVIGYETSFTMALSIQPQHKLMGYHATGTCGVLGIAMAVSYMLDFSPEQTKEAFDTACASATGMLQVLDDGSELKPYNVAKTALLGLISSQMSHAGFKGNPDSLGSYRGFLKMMSGDENRELMEPIYAGTYAIEKTYTKPYAACRYCHPSIDAAIQIRNDFNIIADEIKSIEIRTYDLAVRGHDHTEIVDEASAKMSIPYSVAVALIYGKAGLNEYDATHIRMAAVLELTKKVFVSGDEDLSSAFPQKTTAVVRINTSNRGFFEKQVDFPKGEPQNPLTKEEFKDRFVELATFGGKTTDEALAIYKIVESLNSGDSLSDLFHYL